MAFLLCSCETGQDNSVMEEELCKEDTETDKKDNYANIFRHEYLDPNYGTSRFIRFLEFCSAKGGMGNWYSRGIAMVARGCSRPAR